MKIAIIGAGISGLTAAYILSKKHSITLYEKNNYLGGHANTFQVAEKNKILAIDTGFIVFNHVNYPNLSKIFSDLNVEIEDSDMSFSVHNEKTNLEYNGTSISKIFAQRKNIFNINFLLMLNDILRFNKNSSAILNSPYSDKITVNEFIKSNNYKKDFVENYLIPLGSSLWSCPKEKFMNFSILFVIEFLHNHCMLTVNDRPIWKTVKGGSKEYIKKMLLDSKNLEIIKNSVKKVVRDTKEVSIFTEDNRSYYDEVIIACHPDQALNLVDNLEVSEKAILEPFKYEINSTLLHTDTTVLPSNKSIWASWNYRIPINSQEKVMVTYNMNKLQNIDSKNTYCVSLNLGSKIDQEKIIKEFKYEHPIFFPGIAEYQAQHASLIRNKRISYCGAYWGYGFHEDGVNSALKVCEKYDMGLA
ncbi:MAG: FAD-dependent oxidoreductase [Legionellales bacterium]|nr:FAD-dependent oxidoreductase [Legionellales bacterium]